jgi:hypothetical protein
MNQHYKEAERLSAESSLIHEWPATERAAQAGRGQIEATLALAYEQRTANLIAYERSQWEAWRRDELTDVGVAQWRKAAEQVNERLGLA